MYHLLRMRCVDVQLRAKFSSSDEWGGGVVIYLLIYSLGFMWRWWSTAHRSVTKPRHLLSIGLSWPIASLDAFRP
jgi:hypothetical protein